MLKSILTGILGAAVAVSIWMSLTTSRQILSSRRMFEYQVMEMEQTQMTPDGIVINRQTQKQWSERRVQDEQIRPAGVNRVAPPQFQHQDLPSAPSPDIPPGSPGVAEAPAQDM